MSSVEMDVRVLVADRRWCCYYTYYYWAPG